MYNYNNEDRSVEEGLSDWYSHIHDYVGKSARHHSREREHFTLLRELNQKLKEYIRKNSPLKGNSKFHK